MAEGWQMPFPKRDLEGRTKLFEKRFSAYEKFWQLAA